MKKHLSSHLTVFLKIIFPTIWTLVIVGVTAYTFIDSRQILTLLILLMLLPMWGLINIKQITYDDRNFYIYNWRTTETYQLNDIKSINEGRIGTFDPFFEIEIFEKNGQTKKVDFAPHAFEHLTYTIKNKYTGHLLDFKTKVFKTLNG